VIDINLNTPVWSRLLKERQFYSFRDPFMMGATEKLVFSSDQQRLLASHVSSKSI